MKPAVTFSPVTPVRTQVHAAPRKKSHKHAQPSHEQIARRAFELYASRGRHQGLAEQDWYQAELELKGEKDGCTATTCTKCEHCRTSKAP